jgi:predicted nucleotidyltransferase
MNRETILHLLRENLPGLEERGVKSLLLFGPWARDEGRPKSDIDLLLELYPPHNLDHFIEVKLYITGLLTHPVELVIVDHHNPDIWPLVEPDLIRIA